MPISASVLALDLPTLLQFVLTGLLLAIGLLQFVRATASRKLVVDGRFGAGGAGVADSRSMTTVSGSDDSVSRPESDGGSDSCFVCGSPGSKKCSRCKAVRYCSSTCQANHWKEHKLKCKEFKHMEKVGPLPSSTSSNACGRRAISLVPGRGMCKVLRHPKEVLFPYDEFVKFFNWETSGFPPCGLLNHGNSCFANVVLQCLACTRPLVAFLLEKGHSRKCNRNDWCFLCELQFHVHRVSQSISPFSPINILSRLPNIGSNLGYGKQEDAHEFMRFAVDTMQSICLDEFGGEKALDPSTQETTLIQYIFGGHLQSQVTCTKCDRISYRYENMMDLTVEIQGDVASLEDSLEQFTAKESLDGENMYNCDGCNAYVKAWKRLTIHRAPHILTIALKRFQSGRFGKLNKRVTFPDTLDLGQYMTEAGDHTDVYKLYAVIVHVDMLNASFCGHYICYTKDFSGNWYRIDDCKVMKVEIEEVLNQRAYMLLYSRICALQHQVKTLEDSSKVRKQTVEVGKGLQGSKKLVEHLSISASANLVDAPPCPPSNTIQQAVDSGYNRETPSEADCKTERKEPAFFNLVDSVEVASKLTREDRDGTNLCDLPSSSSGLHDHNSITHCSHIVEDILSVEHRESTKSVSSIKLSIRATAGYCQEPGINSVDCRNEEGNGPMNNEDKGFQLAESSSDASISNEMPETFDVSTALSNQLLNSPDEGTPNFFSICSELQFEQRVLPCNPTTSENGLVKGNWNGFMNSDSTQDIGKIDDLDVSLGEDVTP